MIENIIVWTIIILCTINVSRRLLKQFRHSSGKDSSLECGSGCCNCSVIQCSDKDGQQDLNI